MLDRLYAELADGDLRLVKLAEAHREPLRAACAADGEVWPIYATSFDPDHFDASFTALVANAARMPYAVFAGDRLVGMTAWLRPDVSAQTVEIGSSYIHPDVRGTGLNGRMKRLMLGHAFAVGIRRVEFRIDERNKRSQAAVANSAPPGKACCAPSVSPGRGMCATPACGRCSRTNGASRTVVIARRRRRRGNPQPRHAECRWLEIASLRSQ